MVGGMKGVSHYAHGLPDTSVCVYVRYPGERGTYDTFRYFSTVTPATDACLLP